MYCLYRTITSPCTTPTVQSLQRVLPLLYNHFNVYSLCCTITTCIAYTVQSLHVMHLLQNHFAVYRPYCPITPTGQKYLLQKSFPRQTSYEKDPSQAYSTDTAARGAEDTHSLRIAQWPRCSRIIPVLSRWATSFVSASKS